MVTNSLEPSLRGLEELRGKKNLLAFSAGSDSTALFFLLLRQKIPFDIAIVNYQLRPQSDEEVSYAKELAQSYGKRLYLKTVALAPTNIEHEARSVRYAFFKEIIHEEGYHNLITAHQLNDLFEWFLMQLSKGAGLVELVGMDVVEKREDFTLVRPLLLTPKEQILGFLKSEGIHYFFDESNDDPRFRRNLFRHRFATEFLRHYPKGVAKSFEYLMEDKSLLLHPIHSIEKLLIASRPTKEYETKRLLDRMFKRAGYLLSNEQKEEILRQKSGVIAGGIAFGMDESSIMIAPYVKRKMQKNEKELMRKMKIPPPLRGYILQEGIDLRAIERYRYSDKE